MPEIRPCLNQHRAEMIPIHGIAPFPPIEPIRAGVEVVLHVVPFHAMMHIVKLSLVIGDTDRHPWEHGSGILGFHHLADMIEMLAEIGM